MNATRENDAIVLTLSFFESRLLQRVLGAMIRSYTSKPDQIDPKAAAALYSTRGCETAHLSPEETKEWIEQLHGFKSATLRLLEDWNRQLAGRPFRHLHYQLTARIDDAPSLLMAVNDHRLMAAARHEIGEREMTLNSISAFHALELPRQTALYEIHFLAHVIEEVLRLLPGNDSADNG